LAKSASWMCTPLAETQQAAFGGELFRRE